MDRLLIGTIRACRSGRGIPRNFKAKVALDAIRGELTLAELAKKHGVHPNVVGQWRRLAIENMATAFEGGVAETARDRDAEFEKLHAKIGQLVVERDFLQKAFGR